MNKPTMTLVMILLPVLESNLESNPGLCSPKKVWKSEGSEQIFPAFWHYFNLQIYIENHVSYLFESLPSYRLLIDSKMAFENSATASVIHTSITV